MECLGRVGGDHQWWWPPVTSFLFPLTLHPAAVTETPPHQFFLRPARHFNMKQITAFLLALFSLGSAEISTFSLPSPWSYTCDRSYIQRIYHPHRPLVLHLYPQIKFINWRSPPCSALRQSSRLRSWGKKDQTWWPQSFRVNSSLSF